MLVVGKMSFFAGRKVTVLQCGSFNPPHLLHLLMCEDAREALTAAGATVVEGMISPASSKYGKQGLLDGEHRLAMCQLATRSSDWIRVNDGEVRSETFVRSRAVLE